MQNRILCRILAVGIAILASDAGTCAWGGTPQPPGNLEPLFRLEADGPMAYVTSLVFSADGQSLYAAGWDKVVRVWSRDHRTGKFVRDPLRAYRVPIGPALDGAINAISLSPDGAWLAVAGNGLMRGTEGFHHRGQVQPRSLLTEQMRLDQGLIYLFDLTAPPGRQDTRILAGHLGPVMSLAFAPQDKGQQARLVSVAREWDAEARKDVGAVRLWDVGQGKYLTGLWDLPDPLVTRLRPALEIWRTGTRPDQLRMALAFGDEYLRVWDVEANRLQRLSLGNSQNARVLVKKIAGNRVTVLTGSGDRSGKGTLLRWSVGQDLALGTEAIPASFPQIADVHYAPAALALFSATENGDRDHLAVVVSPSRLKEKHRLLVFALDNPQEPICEANLWSSSGKFPVIAASPRAGFLAVAGNDEHSILIFATADLLQKHTGPLQVLRSRGATVRQAGFVTDAQGKLGLLLSDRIRLLRGDAPHLEKGDLILDPTKRVLVPYKDPNWKPSRPAPAGWEVQANLLRGAAKKGAEGTQFLVKQQGVQKGVVSLAPSKEVDDYALLPPVRDLNNPLLAVAYRESGQAFLSLFDAVSGKEIRQYTGHRERISSLAFSSDGKLLVSASEDQTVCVWSLVDLATTLLGQRGRIPGLEIAATPDGKGVLVHAVRPGSQAAESLQAGDRFENLVEGRTRQAIRKPADFYDAVWHRKPGAEVLLQVAGKAQPFALRVDQGIDSQKPLLSVFLTEAEKPAEREWICWSTPGFYDVSRQRAERLLGWQFNTGDAREPTRFALADQYRKDFYRPGIIEQLLREGKPPAPLPPAPPKPQMSLELEGKSTGPLAENAQGELLAHENALSLGLNIDNYPADKIENWIESVQWQVNDGPVATFRRGSAGDWSADLSQQTWQPGLYRIAAIVRTRGLEPKEYREDVIVRYQPLPPTIEVTSPAAHPLPGLKILRPDDQRVFYRGRDSEQIQLEGRILWPGSRSPCEAILDVNGRSEDKPVSINPQMTSLVIPVALHAGNNLLRLRLRNSWGSERAFDPIHVRYLQAPVIVVEPAPTVSDQARVDLVANVTSPVPLQTIDVEINGSVCNVKNELTKIDQAKGSWRLRLPSVPLEDGRLNQVRVWATSVEMGRSLQPGEWRIECKRTAHERSPEIDELDVPPKTSEPALKFQFHITSTSALSRVELVHQSEGRLTRRHRINVGELKSLRPDYFEGQAEITLDSGANQLSIEAENVAGVASSRPSFLSYLPVPARLILDVIQPVGSTGQPQGVALPVADNDLSRIAPLPNGQVLLRGRIQTLKPGDEQLRLEGGVWIYVNGLRQLLSRTLDQYDSKSNERRFETRLVLSADINRIELAAPGVSFSENELHKQYLACASPVADRRLHLLILGPENSNQEELRARALAALQAKQESAASFSKPGFEPGILYPVLTGPAATWQLSKLLVHVRKEILRLGLRRPMNEIVMIYYQGSETIDSDQQPRWGDDRWGSAERALSETPGAAVFLLDVTHRGPDSEARAWPDQARVGVLRCVWLDANTPDPAPLLQALQQARARQLKQLADQVRTRIDQISQKTAELRHQEYIPEDLEDLPVGPDK